MKIEKASANCNHFFRCDKEFSGSTNTRNFRKCVFGLVKSKLDGLDSRVSAELIPNQLKQVRSKILCRAMERYDDHPETRIAQEGLHDFIVVVAHEGMIERSNDGIDDVLQVSEIDHHSVRVGCAFYGNPKTV